MKGKDALAEVPVDNDGTLLLATTSTDGLEGVDGVGSGGSTGTETVGVEASELVRRVVVDGTSPVADDTIDGGSSGGTDDCKKEERSILLLASMMERETHE